jgi:ribosomal protein S24E
MEMQADLFEPRKKTNLNLMQKVAQMERYLLITDYNRVVPVKQFKSVFGWSDRVCRSIVNESEGRIIATESGYVLTRRATPEEFNEANGRIYSQAKAMMRRALRERRVRHQQVGGKL